MITALFIVAEMEVSQLLLPLHCSEAWSQWPSSLERESECAEVHL